MSSPRCRSSALGPICGVRLCCLACFCSLLPTHPLHPHHVLFFFSFFSSVVSLSQSETNIRPHPLGAFRCIPTAGRHPPFRCQAMSILPFWPTDQEILPNANSSRHRSGPLIGPLIPYPAPALRPLCKPLQASPWIFLL